jgi:hypothetical protein
VEVFMSVWPWWRRVLLAFGTLCMLVGAIDPLEGSVIILPGAAMVALETFLGGSRHTRLLARAAALVGLGIVALFAVSALGGIGGPKGLPMWAGLVLLPYPIGWLMAVVGAVLRVIEARRSPRLS